MTSELTTPIQCPQGLVYVTEPAENSKLRFVYYKDLTIGSVKQVSSDKVEIKAKVGASRKGLKYGLQFACCTILTAYLISVQQKKEMEF